MTIVIPVDNDKQTIFTRTGRAPYFAIFDNETFLDAVENAHAKSHHDDEHHHHEEHTQEEVLEHKQDLEAIAKYDVMLYRALGPNMKEAIELLGIKVQKISKKEANLAIEAVKKFLNNELISQKS